MRIVHVTPHYHPAVGGAETYTKEVSERLARRGHDVIVVAMNHLDSAGTSPLARHETINGVRVVRFSPAGKLHGLASAAVRTSASQRVLRAAGPGWVDGADTWAKSPYGLGALLNIVHLRPDVVAVINWYGGWLPRQACIAQRFRRFSLIGVPFFHTEIGWAHAEAFGEMLDCCDAVCAMTDHEREFVGQRSRTRTHAIGVGVDPSVFAQADGNVIRARHKLGDAPVVGYVGRMDPSKGLVPLIRAMENVWQTRPDAHLLLAGGGPAGGAFEQGEIGAALSALRPEQRALVTVTGRFDESEKASLFDALDVFAMPSFAESFGITYLEAWMREKPVIASRLASTQCIVDDGIDGLLVGATDVDEIARAIIRLLGDSSLRERMGRAGRAKTFERYTWDKIAESMERVYVESRKGSSHAGECRAVPG